jgi:uncharacterized protein
VAATQAGRQQGLMQRTSLAKNRGMIFVFAQRAKHCMWMRNTLIPLSVAFLDERGAIINIEDMQPRTEVNHCAAESARFALEMNKGWFRERGFKPGTVVHGAVRLLAGE